MLEQSSANAKRVRQPIAHGAFRKRLAAALVRKCDTEAKTQFGN